MYPQMTSPTTFTSTQSVTSTKFGLVVVEATSHIHLQFRHLRQIPAITATEDFQVDVATIEMMRPSTTATISLSTTWYAMLTG
jgi:hypothetical protein